jgi:hypothetical protein
MHSIVVFCLPTGEAWIVPRFAALPTPHPVNSVVTHLGEDFLAFISEPRETAPLPVNPERHP